MTFLKKKYQNSRDNKPFVWCLTYVTVSYKTASSFVFVLPHEQIDPALDLDAGIITVSAMVSSMNFFINNASSTSDISTEVLLIFCRYSIGYNLKNMFMGNKETLLLVGIPR